MAQFMCMCLSSFALGSSGFLPLSKIKLVSVWTKINCPVGLNMCAMCPAKDWHLIQGVFLLHAQFPWNLHNLNENKVVEEAIRIQII